MSVLDMEVTLRPFHHMPSTRTDRKPHRLIFEVWGVLDHYARSVPGATDVEMPHELLRVNHYAT